MSRSWHASIGGKYVLGERVGEGGMGVVHRAEQPALARTVAIKLLRPELATDPRINARFRAEALAVAQLAHPNLVTVIDFGETDDGTPFVVMEYVRGRTLGELAREGAEVSIERAVALVTQILAGLGAAHAAGVVHADVKSDNVLVGRDHDGTERIKLIDFGLARLAHGDDHVVGEILGTPEYMAPEVIGGAAPTPAADLYGVGVILYELLTGALPFTGATSAQILTRHLHDLVVPPSLRRPDRGIGAALEQVIAMALAKSPVLRLTDASQFAAALAAATPRRPVDLDCAPVQLAAEDPTRPWRLHDQPVWDEGAPRVALGSGCAPTPHAEREVRREIGEAIACGAVEAITHGYVSLAALLTHRGQVHAAILELEEAVDMVTAGEGPDAVVDETAPLVDVLLGLYATVNDQREAYGGAAEHWRTLTESVASR